MKLINYPPYDSLEIEFVLDADERLFKMGEDFCLYLDIVVSLRGKSHSYERILIDKTSVKLLIEHISKYLNKEIDEIYYTPQEEHFWLFDKKPKLGEEEFINVIDGMGKAGYSKETIEELRNSPKTITLILLINREFADMHGWSPISGEAYIIDVTKENLNSFLVELRSTYETLTANT